MQNKNAKREKHRKNTEKDHSEYRFAGVVVAVVGRWTHLNCE